MEGRALPTTVYHQANFLIGPKEASQQTEAAQTHPPSALKARQEKERPDLEETEGEPQTVWLSASQEIPTSFIVHGHSEHSTVHVERTERGGEDRRSFMTIRQSAVYRLRFGLVDQVAVCYFIECCKEDGFL